MKLQDIKSINHLQEELGKPIYKTKPYLLMSKDRKRVLFSGSGKELIELKKHFNGNYYFNNDIVIREYDLYLNNNELNK